MGNAKPTDLFRIQEIRTYLDEGWSLIVACRKAGTCSASVRNWAMVSEPWQELMDYYSIVHEQRIQRRTKAGATYNPSPVRNPTAHERMAMIPKLYSGVCDV